MNSYLGISSISSVDLFLTKQVLYLKGFLTPKDNCKRQICEDNRGREIPFPPPPTPASQLLHKGIHKQMRRKLELLMLLKSPPPHHLGMEACKHQMELKTLLRR